MPKVGDRVIIEGSKVGVQRREGSLIGLTGPLIKVRWTDGSESLLKPGAGSVTYEPAKSTKKTAAAAKGAAPAKTTASAKKAAALKKTAAKPAASKTAARGVKGKSGTKKR